MAYSQSCTQLCCTRFMLVVNSVPQSNEYVLYNSLHWQVRSLTRGSIAERSGVRVGHYIIEINGTSTVGLTHKDLVHLLTTTVGDVSPPPWDGILLP